ncbi:MAG: hypothetical protein ABSG62_15795 [Terracidiphilus sp.]
MSLRKAGGFILLAVQAVLAVIGLLVNLPAGAQYPGQVTKSAKDSPELRSIAVLEWTGEEGNPKASRLVPVAVLDGGQLQDGGIYLARPEPLALVPEVEYELEQNGKPVGLFDIKNAGQQQGSWVGFGAWKPMPAARPKPSARDLARNRIDDDEQSDEPVLHRKHHADDAPAGGTGNGGGSGSSSGTGADSGGQAQTSDPDRPTLHKKSSSDSTSGTSASPGTGSASSNPNTGSTSSNPGTDSGSSNPSAGSPASTSTSSSTASDSDRPTLHKKDSSSDSAGSGSGTSSAPADDADRPVLKKSKKNQPADIGHAEALPDATDPDRPRLKRGKSSGNDIDVAPSLMGFPPDLQQAVAVSDARTRPEHLWSYVWSNPDDEAKMKSSLEDIARDALGLNPPPPKAASAPKRAPAKKTARPAPPPPPPAPLVDEQFRVFELAYGSGATLVLTAHTDGPAAQQKFVTLVAQPDLYGNVLVLLKNVTDGAHLDEKPRMRLVDAVDALADNRGELLFELRGATQRQFALYRVLRGQAEKLFVSGGGEFGTENRE